MIAAVQALGTRRGLTAIVPLRAAASIPPVEPVSAMTSTRLDRRSDFLAQLIATRDGMAQTRERRRATHSEAAQAYRSGARRQKTSTSFDETA